MIDKYRVKDNIDLKLFEQKGFRKEKMISDKIHWANAYIRLAGFKIDNKLKGEVEQEIVFYELLNKKDKDIFLRDALELRWNYKSDLDISQYIQDLINANLVEEVKENERNE